jgi:hypothetical protein
MTRLLVVATFLAASSAMASPLLSDQQLVSFNTVPEGSEWMGSFIVIDSEERRDFEARRWADEARHHTIVEAKPAVVKRTTVDRSRRTKPKSTTSGV